MPSFPRSFVALSVLLGAACCGSRASADLVVYGNRTTPDTTTGILAYDLETGTSSTFFDTTGIGLGFVNGLAADNDAGLLYWLDATRIHTINISDRSLLRSVGLTGFDTSITGGLAVDPVSGTLYGSETSDNLYTIDPITGLVTNLGDVTVGGSAAMLGGLDWDEVGGRLLATDDGAADALIEIDLTTLVGSVITPYPTRPGGSTETDVDGLAVGRGVAYLTNDFNGDGIYRYDLATDTFLSGLPTNYAANGITSGGAFIRTVAAVPEPATTGLLGLAGIAGLL
ncbi:MAG: hypothetical protein AAF907_11335, partial [Planctomycetota bacterium]